MIKQDVLLFGTAASSYPIFIGSKLLESIPSFIPKTEGTLVIITDHHVSKLYASMLEQSLKKEGYKTLLLSFIAGEKSKNIRTKSRLEEKMLAACCDRDTLILALGGGVVGDLAGFIAATYMRGIPFIQIPTTLLAMLDSSVGGKTGINMPQGKNLIGAYWQPKRVISDVKCLNTLPKKHIINGLIEALKMFLARDSDSLLYFEQNLALMLSCDDKTLINLIHRAVKVKAEVVMNDEKEKDLRVILNLGHTIGHALEQLTNYKMLHGYAVALGLLVEVKIAQLMGVVAPQAYEYIKILLNNMNISEEELKKFDVNDVIKKTYLDKKNRAGLVNYVLLQELGKVYEMNNQFAHPVADEVVKRAFLEINEE